MNEGNTYIIVSDNTGEDGKRIQAYDSEDAAEKYAEWSDEQGDYSIIRGSSEKLTVESPDGSIRKFEVYGVIVNTYHAKELI